MTEQKKKYREEFTPYFFFLQENTMCIRWLSF